MLKFMIKKQSVFIFPIFSFILGAYGMQTAKKVWTYLVIAFVALIGAVNYELFVFPNQFAPAGSGHLSRTPNAESVVAAKLCLEGANTAGNALYFVNPVTSPGSWASRNRPYVATIGAHAFYA